MRSQGTPAQRRQNPLQRSLDFNTSPSKRSLPSQTCITENQAKYGGRFLPTHGPEGPTISGLRSLMVFAPMLRIVFVISCCKTVVRLALVEVFLGLGTSFAVIARMQGKNLLCNNLETPSSPCVLLAYKNGRPKPTALAPRARAFTTSAPERKPPSTMISIFWNKSGLSTRISYRMSMGAGAKSACLPPWFD